MNTATEMWVRLDKNFGDNLKHYSHSDHTIFLQFFFVQVTFFFIIYHSKTDRCRGITNSLEVIPQ